MKILCIPIHLDALVVNEVEPVIGAANKFDNLPYRDEHNLDINSDRPFLASQVTRRTYENIDNLPAGVHLHWSLPDALTQGICDGDEIDMPAAPDRWLIKRINSAGKLEKQWVVESDYLYPTGIVPERAIAIPFNDPDTPDAPPYRYLGRQLTLESWKNEQASRFIENEYLGGLNVLGWGSPYFSALYTECYSVFGAYDDDISLEDLKNVKYQVYGWHSENGVTTDDYVKNALNSGTFSEQQTLANEKAEWNIIDDPDNLDDAKIAERGVYCGSVTFSDTPVFNDGIDSTQTELSLAKTSGEAIASHLSKLDILATTEDESLRVENQLQSTLFSHAMSGENIDFVNSLKMARHSEEFVPEEAETLWAYTPFNSLTTEEFKKTDLDHEGFKKAYHKLCRQQLGQLDQLNGKLTQSHKADAKLNSMRQVLYADWSKYMQCRYPLDSDDHMPQADLIKHMILEQSIPDIKAILAFIDSIKPRIEALKSSITNSFKTLCSNHNVTDALIVGSILEEIPGPRYWCPKEPSLMIDGDVAKRSKRHGLDGILECTATTISGKVVDWLLDLSVTKALDLATKTNNNDTETINKVWEQQPWNPLCIEWRVEMFSESCPEQSVTSNQIDYGPDHITSHYRIPLNDNEFSLPGASVDYFYKKQQGISIDDTPNTVCGRSLLTFLVKDQVEQKIQDALENMGETGGDIALKETLKNAQEYLHTSHILTQQLQGFHDNLLMYNTSMSLEIKDPSEFSSEYNAFTASVKDALAGEFYKLPSIENQFTPIKSGTTRLKSVRVIDSFGRFKDINCDHVTHPQRDMIGNTMYTPPRVLQPMRLSFRWKNRLEEATQEHSPICGWINYNVFDETIVCYDTAGRYLGTINSDGEWTDEYGVFITLDVIEDSKLKTFILKLLSFHNANRIVRPQTAEGLTFWNLLRDNNLLSPLKGGDDLFACEKAQVIPLTEDNWQNMGISLSGGRDKLEEIRSSNNHFPSLKKAIQRAQDNIEPDVTDDQSQAVSVNPLAVVSAALDLQLYGDEEINKSWASLSRDLMTNERSTRGYTDVKFPIKLGEFNNLDDGLVAYWEVNPNGSLGHKGAFPQSDMADVDEWIDSASFHQEEHDYIDAVSAEGVINVEQSFNDSPMNLLMLMDPQAVVHATSGIVPKKTLRLDPLFYNETLHKIESRYFAAPLLTPIDTLSMPLSRNETWLWQQTINPGNHSERSSLPTTERFPLDGVNRDLICDDDWQLLFEKKVLLPVNGSSDTQGYFIKPNKEIIKQINEINKTGTTSNWTDLEVVLKASTFGGIVPPDQIEALTQKICAVEGWLQSKPMDTSE